MCSVARGDPWYPVAVQDRDFTALADAATGANLQAQMNLVSVSAFSLAWLKFGWQILHVVTASRAGCGNLRLPLSTCLFQGRNLFF